MEGLLAEVKGLSAVKGRAVAGFLGALVADAAGQPLQWIYNDDTMSSAISADPDKPEFISPSKNGFYKLPTGAQSNFGDQMMVTVRSLAHSKGLNIESYTADFIKAFGEGSEYDKFAKLKSNPETKRPIEGPWSNGTMVRFVELQKEGKTARDVTDDKLNDPDIFPRGYPLLLVYAGKPTGDSVIRDFTTLMQSSEVSLGIMDAAYKLAELYITNGEKEGEDNVKKLIDMLNASPAENKFILSILNEAHGSQSTSIKDATKNFGKGCSIPGSFQASLRAVLNDKGYTETVREVIRSGGDICSRLHTVGFCLGAKYGIDSIPRSWIDKTFAAEEGLRLALQIVKMS
ncbi:PREDICTED: crystallin J1A-like isoform X1 [Amphimedon queenslandica]|uniref:Uncharacterized protein n=1 Tax=Amphimedon queenslandica TaxID=400682 RepID=A0AAN0IJZ0_AMPQE|nr:PREDICTED: crystallin J1A-like isoform X1 [Amphimedon queenslandica]|eukprot:XP_011402421.1 PREDICTED: crystallin J1A-like isoform X1 [Amphimedon queenslandica]